jgi:hypothetical protein
MATLPAVDERECRVKAPRRAVRIVAPTAIGAVVMSVGLTIGASPAHADAAYTATGGSNGFDVVLKNAAIPVVSALEFAGPTAQATLDSLDQSNSFASFPYPGDEVVGVPGLAGSIVGLPVPAYPAYTSSSYGQDPGDKDLPGVHLHAQSGHTSSQAEARVGSAGAGTGVSTVDNELTPSGITSTAKTAVDALNIGGVIRLSGVRSEATASRDTSGKLTSSSVLSFGQLSVPGLALALPPSLNLCPINQLPISGIPALPCPSPISLGPLGGTILTAPDLGFENGSFTLTLPQLGNQKFAIPFDVVAAALKASGVDVTYQAPVALKDGIMAPALHLHTVLPGFPVPLPSNPVVATPGPTDVTLTLGQSSATVQYQAFDTSGDTGFSLGSIGTGAVPTTQTGGGGGTSTATTGVTQGTGSGALPGGTQTGPLDTATGPAPAVAGEPGGAAAPATSLVAQRAAKTVDSADIYLVLVGAALLAFGATQAVRLLGVRKPWTS